MRCGDKFMGYLLFVAISNSNILIFQKDFGALIHFSHNLNRVRE